MPSLRRRPPTRLRRRASVARTDLRFRYRARYGPLPAFVVVGTGRCGTQYASDLLTVSGLACGHEEVFTPFGVQRRPGLVGDASWHAVPFVARLGIPAIHLVRRPLDVVNSFLAIGFFRPWDEQRVRHRPARRFADRYLTMTGDETIDAVRWCVAWNHWCERVTFTRVRVDDTDGLLAAATRVTAGSRQVPRRATGGAAGALPPTTTNTHLEQPFRVDDARHLTLDDLPDHAASTALLELTRRYGYA